MFDVEIQEGTPRMKLPYNLTGMCYGMNLEVSSPRLDV